MVVNQLAAAHQSQNYLQSFNPMGVVGPGQNPMMAGAP